LTKRPRWLEICHQNLIPLLEHTSASLSERNDLDPHVRTAPLLASYHLHQCVLSSVDANEKGRYSVAMALLRQCIEALTIVDAGLQPGGFATEVLLSWRQGQSRQGQIRKTLEAERWPLYGRGLWQEPWAEYFGNLARAVQPYAHYSPTLMGWQYSVPATVQAQGDEPIAVRSYIGLNAKDLLKGARVSLFISLVGWTVARLLERNDISCPMRGEKLTEWGKSIGNSDLLDGSTSCWPDVFLPHLFFYDEEFRP
jgi:hypothetical protein